MEKPQDRNDVTLLVSRFHALMERVQGIIDELDGTPSPVSGENRDMKPCTGSGQKSYVIHAPDLRDERCQKALIKVIDDTLTQIDHAVSSSAEKDTGSESKQRAFFQAEKKLFTLEELHFLEDTFRTFHRNPPEGTHPR